MNKEEICDSMTVQDAVRVLKETNCYGTMDIAKSVIIKALEQQPYEDCISRAEAIKALEYELSIEADGGLDKYRTVIKDLVNAIYNTQKKAIEDLPSIQSQPKERTKTHACDCVSRKGHWITQWNVTHQKEYYYCSECREEFSYDGETGIKMNDYSYCPNCGSCNRGRKE